MQGKKHSGQAMVEYLLIFGLMAGLSVKLFQGLSSFLNDRIGNLGYALSRELASGVCGGKQCFYSRYKNQIEFD